MSTDTTAPADTATSDAAPDTDAAPPAEPTTDLQAEVDKWKALARKHEDRAKANADAQRDLDQLRQQVESEQERVVREAVAAAKAEVSGQYQGQLLQEALRAAAGGILNDPSDAVRLIDTDGLLDDNGMPDRSAITSRVADLLEAKPYLAAVKPTTQQPGGSAEAGSRGAPGAGQQLTRDDLQSMSPQQIVEAQAQGRLDGLLGRH